mgnify:CR=1 FL=1
MPNLMGSYSPNDVSVVVNGIPIQGFAEGSFVDFAFDTDAATMVEGADGFAAVAMKKGNRKATLTLSLMQTSMANNVLQALLTSQQAASFAGAFPSIIVLNAQGGELVQIPRAVIAKEPDVKYSGDIESREWKFVGQAKTETLGYGV